MQVKIAELEVSDNIMEIVQKEVKKIQNEAAPTFDQINRLEKLTKIYGVLMASTRENIKHGLYAHLKFEDGADVGEGGGNGDDADSDLDE